MNKLFENPQKGMQSFDALMKLQEKIDKSSSEQKQCQYSGNILATENQQVRINDVIEVKSGVKLHKT